MKECWINVYSENLFIGTILGKACYSREQSINVAKSVLLVANIKVIYRIHVRMK